MKKLEVIVAVRGDRLEPEAPAYRSITAETVTGCDGICIHRELLGIGENSQGRLWTITHVASGLSVCRGFRTKVLARVMANIIYDAVPNDFDWELRKSPRQSQRSYIKSVNSGMGKRAARLAIEARKANDADTLRSVADIERIVKLAGEG